MSVAVMLGINLGPPLLHLVFLHGEQAERHALGIAGSVLLVALMRLLCLRLLCRWQPRTGQPPR